MTTHSEVCNVKLTLLGTITSMSLHNYCGMLTKWWSISAYNGVPLLFSIAHDWRHSALRSATKEFNLYSSAIKWWNNDKPITDYHSIFVINQSCIYVPDHYRCDNEPCQEGPWEAECVCINWHYFCIIIALQLHTGCMLSGRALVAESRALSWFDSWQRQASVVLFGPQSGPAHLS